MTAVLGDSGGGRAEVGADEVAPVLGVELGGERRRADEVAEHDRDRAALGGGIGGFSRRRDRRGQARAFRAAIASRSFRRWPTIVTPRSFRSSAVRLKRISPSIALSRNALSYRPSPRFLSQAEMCTIASTQRDRIITCVSEFVKRVASIQAAVVKRRNPLTSVMPASWRLSDRRHCFHSPLADSFARGKRAGANANAAENRFNSGRPPRPNSRPASPGDEFDRAGAEGLSNRASKEDLDEGACRRRRVWRTGGRRLSHPERRAVGSGHHDLRG